MLVELNAHYQRLLVVPRRENVSPVYRLLKEAGDTSRLRNLLGKFQQTRTNLFVFLFYVFLSIGDNFFWFHIVKHYSLGFSTLSTCRNYMNGENFSCGGCITVTKPINRYTGNRTNKGVHGGHSAKLPPLKYDVTFDASAFHKGPLA